MAPSLVYRAMLMKIAPFDDSYTSTLSTTALDTYKSTWSNYSEVFQKDKLSPSNSWAVPFVTGHKYRITWDKGQLNWSLMGI